MTITIVATVGSATANRRGQSQPYGAGKTLFVCPVCSTEFRQYRSQVKAADPYCSRACFFASKVGKAAHNKGKTTRVASICIECGGWMFGTVSGLRRHKLCSAACQGRYLSGSNAPMWRGGVSSERMKLQNSPEYRQWRLAVLIRDGGRCRQCDADGTRTFARLEVHHIIPVSASWDHALTVGNGITLCRNHHITTLGREHEMAGYFASLVGAPLVATPTRSVGRPRRAVA